MQFVKNWCFIIARYHFAPERFKHMTDALLCDAIMRQVLDVLASPWVIIVDLDVLHNARLRCSAFMQIAVHLCTAAQSVTVQTWK